MRPSWRSNTLLICGLATVTPGCVFTYKGTPKVERVPRDSPPTIRPDALHGTGELLADGRFRFSFATDQLCQRERIADEKVTTTEHKQFSLGGRVLFGASLAALGTGIYVLATQSGATQLAAGLPLTVSGTAVIITFGILRLSNTTHVTPGVAFDDATPAKVGDPVFWKGFTDWSVGKIEAVNGDGTLRVSQDGKVVVRGSVFHPDRFPPDEVRRTQRTTRVIENTPCPGDVLGGLSIAAPWGAVDGPHELVGSPPSTTFPIDWNVDFDPATDAGRARLAGPWLVQSAKHGTVASFNLGAAEVTRAAALVAQSRTRTVKGATPANLLTAGLTADGGALVVGGTTTVRISIENRGASTAREVTVTSRSSLAQLHDLKISFGLIQPGKQTTKSISITLPDGVTGDTATVVLAFSEATGQIPANVTQQLKLARTVCPQGKLTRAQYDQKRAKLQKAVNDGTMTQDEFNKFDAELVNCIQ